MKREPDRFIETRSARDQRVSAEAFVSVTDERRRGLWSRWRYPASALAIAAAAAALATGVTTGQSTRRIPAASPPARPAPTSSAASHCVRTRGYGGLGGRASEFDANNNNSTDPSGPSPGTAFYMVTATLRGCVTAFAVQDFTGPPITAGDLLFLVSHPYLPADAKQLVSLHTCAIWSSARLKRATGRAYAEATSSAQIGGKPGRAQIAATSNPSC